MPEKVEEILYQAGNMVMFSWNKRFLEKVDFMQASGLLRVFGLERVYR